jgi:manganese-transporting P-type ATPase
MIQFAIHMVSLIYVHSMAKELEPVYVVDCSTIRVSDSHLSTLICLHRIGRIDLEKSFEPSLVNSAVYLISINMQISTFAINYQGHPFMQSLLENVPLRNCLILIGGLTYLAAAQVLPGISSMLEIVDMSATVCCGMHASVHDFAVL